MEDTFERALRLITALEDLARQEDTVLRSCGPVDAGLMLDFADRAAPLVQALGALPAVPSLAKLQPRFAELMAVRQRQAGIRQSHLQRLQEGLRQINESRIRVARLAPVYGTGISAAAPAESRLKAAV